MFTSGHSIVIQQVGKGLGVLEIHSGLKAAGSAGGEGPRLGSRVRPVTPEQHTKRVVDHRANRAVRSDGKHFRFGEQIVGDVQCRPHTRIITSRPSIMMCR